MEIPLRFGAAILMIVIGVLAYRLWTQARLVMLRRTQRARFAGIDAVREGVPAILYFATPDCFPCKTVQGPSIETLQAQFGERLQIVKVDASERIDLADAWGILSVPTTFIIDAQGQPRHVNNGIASAAKLRQQLREYVGLDDLTGTSVRIGSRVKVTGP